ncbi:DUF1036 domain-containing protein [Alkalicaulis satelles]|uniref:DUF1036 domain-containing protein n=1 Tax=Alkalicaulis satelles TaxID=2609175 RepID=A0A5M6ZJ96_9PROT|nr:DUF1036 domain-containing protein [Alkalicaulis satelles]KAA5802301.1 DUF1036 domain-containing protein [Alkalicaulis satelles]
MLAIIAALAVQTGGSDTLVTLCNETPARAAFSVVRPGDDGAEIQRGWFTVEPGACLEGNIGLGRAGQAQVHARSGSFVWPAQGGAALCVPAGSHDGPVTHPPCAQTWREAQFALVTTGWRENRHHVRYEINCRDLPGDDAALCLEGRAGPDGHAARLRELTVCNRSSASLRAAVAGETQARSGQNVTGWQNVAPGECMSVWRQFPYGPELYLRVEHEADDMMAAGESAYVCMPEGWTARAHGVGRGECPEAGHVPVRFQIVRFRDGVDRLRLDLGP